MEGIYPDQASGSQLCRWLDRAETDVLIVGHTHIAYVLDAPGGGLVGNPRCCGTLPSGARCKCGTAFSGTARRFRRFTGRSACSNCPRVASEFFRASDGIEVDIVDALECKRSLAQPRMEGAEQSMFHRGACMTAPDVLSIVGPTSDQGVAPRPNSFATFILPSGKIWSD